MIYKNSKFERHGKWTL